MLRQGDSSYSTHTHTMVHQSPSPKVNKAIVGTRQRAQEVQRRLWGSCEEACPLFALQVAMQKGLKDTKTTPTESRAW